MTDNQQPVPAPWPIFASLAGYTARSLPQDLIAGLTLAAIAIPEQMATARLGGFPAEIGFLAFIAGVLAFAAFGANRFMSVGADSTITPIFAGGLLMWGAAGSANYAGMAATLALAVGIILIASSVLRLGWVADILSVPVMTGFLAGISIHIVASQLPGLLGVAHPSGSMLHGVFTIATHLGQANLYSAALGFAVLFLTLGSERINPRIPGALAGLVGSTAAVLFFGLESRGVDVLGVVPSEIPHISVPTITFGQIVHILPLALIVSVIVMLQTAATTRSFVSEPGRAPRVDRDFLGAGAANILAGLFGAFPVNASPPRTAVVAETGGRSQLAGLLAAAIVFGLAAFGAKLLAHVPHAAMAGILLFVALRIFRLPLMIQIYRRTIQEFALVVVTMVAIVVLPIETGVGLGIVLSLLHGIWATTRARAIELEQVPGTTVWWAPNPKLTGETKPGVLVVAFQAPLSFLNAYNFKQGVSHAIRHHAQPLKLVVLEASSIVAIDFTAAQLLIEVITLCHTQNVIFAVARLESLRAQKAFADFGITDLLGDGRQFHSVDEAIRMLAGADRAAGAPA